MDGEVLSHGSYTAKFVDAIAVSNKEAISVAFALFKVTITYLVFVKLGLCRDIQLR